MKFKTLASSLAAILLTGCAISTPPTKPNEATAEIEDNQTYHVIVTHATIADDFTERRKFFQLTEQVENSLTSTPGIVNFSKRANLFSNEAWTLTVWQDPAAIAAFKANAPHLNAISNAGQVLTGARFARFVVKGADLPVSWEFALQQLENQNQGYAQPYGG